MRIFTFISLCFLTLFADEISLEKKASNVKSQIFNPKILKTHDLTEEKNDKINFSNEANGKKTIFQEQNKTQDSNATTEIKSDFNATKILKEANFTDVNATIKSQSNLQEINSTQPAKSLEISKFKGANFALPSDAKILNRIIVQYINSSGREVERYIDINKSIDWRDDFIIQSRVKPHLSRALDVSVTTKFDDERQTRDVVALAPHLEMPLEMLKFDDGLRFVIKHGVLKVLTDDVLKSFESKNGKITAEFFREESNLTSVNFYVKKGGFGDINVTKSDGIYTLEVSSEGNFSLRDDVGGYMIYKE